ncbi:hypothetical protein [Oleiharenicola sp. Vm1]|uniref:hypothetical protein n=1 Tax=Oleiharenicola sp. Vm1 TaxID=3398393 RepID=UPI0039F59F44
MSAAPKPEAPTATTKSALMRGMPTRAGGAAGATPKAEVKPTQKKPFEEAKATGPCLRLDWDGGVTTLLVPWIAFSESLNMGNKMALVFGNIEVTVFRKTQAAKDHWQLEELVALLSLQKIARLRDDPEIGCCVQAFRLETNSEGETERHPIVKRYEEVGLADPDEDEAPEAE